jgi:hypothetical protein
MYQQNHKTVNLPWKPIFCYYLSALEIIFSYILVTNEDEGRRYSYLIIANANALINDKSK